ncbi:MAG: DUF4405 domain-containing protein [Bacteroidales bacterium]|nr:DUF4405 domain-containing protein [Bacteroidales bacterium]
MNHKLQFESFSPGRHFWMSVHNMGALLFCFFAIFHILYNWRPLINHFKKIKGIRISKEAILASIVVVGLVMLFSSHAFYVK